MSAIIMQRQQEVHGPLGVFFRWFNRGFDWFKALYAKMVEFLLRIRLLVIPIFIVGLVATGWIYQTTPQGFIPEEDQGYLFTIIEAPAGVSLNYSVDLVKRITQEVMLPLPEVEHVVGNAGFGFEGNASNKTLFFVKLKEWEERPGADKSVFGILKKINLGLQQKVPEARAIAVNAPPVDGLGSTGGFELYIQNKEALPMEALIDNTQKVIAAAQKRPELAGVFTQFTFNTPMMQIEIDRNQAKAQNIQVSDIFNTLQTYLGASFVNQYVLGGRLYRVYAQAEGTVRSNPQDISRLYVRSQDGNLVQLSTLVQMEQFSYPPIVTHYNVYPSIKIQGAPAPGFSTGQAITAIEQVATQVLQPGFGYAWTGTAFQEQSSGGAAPIIFGLAFVMVFLVLAAQYESYIDPTIIMITVPLAILGALGAVVFRANVFQAGTVWPAVNNNIYAQVALVMLIGLASKNAILIVEFANQSLELGMSIPKAAIRAAEERLRPILMTAFAGLVGFWPLVIAKGAGAMSRWSLGTALFGGYLISTILSLFLVPVLYVTIKELEERFLKPGKPGKPDKPSKPEQPQPPQVQEEKEQAISKFQPSAQEE
jgi:hydrophobe/amphiphile efflux-1 (HAE1) family protein